MINASRICVVNKSYLQKSRKLCEAPIKTYFQFSILNIQQYRLLLLIYFGKEPNSRIEIKLTKIYHNLDPNFPQSKQDYSKSSQNHKHFTKKMPR